MVKEEYVHAVPLTGRQFEWIKGHADRFWSRTKPGANGCIEWTGLLTPCGYGRFWVGDTMRRAHRVVWVLVHGSDVPSGMTVDHLCRNRRCVNPAHLEAVPSAVNTLRGRTLSAANKAKTHCARGHELSGKNLVWRSKTDGSRYRVCEKCDSKRSRAAAREQQRLVKEARELLGMGHVEYVAQYGQSRKVAAEIIRNITPLELREVEK